MPECAYKAIMDMIEKMKEDIAKTQNISYPEQIRVAEIYYVVAHTLSEACRVFHGKKQEHCSAKETDKKIDVSMDTFILLSRLKEDGFISEEYANKLFEGLIKMKPELEAQVRQDREKGLL
jgi:hypothetical protein